MSRFPHVVLAIIASIAIITACSKEKVNESDPLHDELLEIEAQLDSDVVMIDRLVELQDSAFSNREDSALFCLNFARGMKLRKIILTDDTILAPATSYFSETHQTRRAMLAWYYRACIHFDNGNYPEAVYCAMRMKPYADELNDHLFLARFGDILGNANNHFEQSGASYYVYALEQYHMYDPKNSYMIRVYYSRAYRDYLGENKLDSAQLINERVMELALNSDWPDFIEQWKQQNEASHDQRRIARFHEAEKLYNQIAPQGQSFDPETVEYMVVRRLRKAMIYDDSVALQEAKLLIADGANEILLGSDGMITPKELNEEQILKLSDRFEPTQTAAETNSGSTLKLIGFVGVGLLVVILIVLGLLPLRNRKK